MKIYKIIIVLLILQVSFSLVAMESRLTQREAARLFWDTVENYNDGSESYEEYKENMKNAINVLPSDQVQDRYHDPLQSAVHREDIEFVRFLLNHGASPLFSSMNGRSAYDFTANETTSFERQRSDRNLNKRAEIRRIFDEWTKQNQNQ